MKVKCIYGIDYDSNIYLITGEKNSVVDTGTGLHNKRVVEEIEEYVNPKKIDQIVITHEHFDHTGGIKKIKKHLSENSKIISHKKAAFKIEKGESNFAKMLGTEMESVPVDIKIDEGDEIDMGNEKWLVLYTPGHSEGSICLYEEKSKSLISGDTIFAYGSFGRYDLPGGNANLLRKSIERISKLDVDNLYPGHESIVEGDANKHIKKTLQNTSYIWYIMTNPRIILNKFKWKENTDFKEIKVEYTHRGAPNDKKMISGEEIIDVGRSFMKTNSAEIPFHRVIKIKYRDEIIFERKKHTWI